MIEESHAFTVTLNLSISAKEIDHLMKQSQKHYDNECRIAGRQGGFLYGWKNQIRNGFAHVNVPFRALDTCAKILELPESDLDLYRNCGMLMRRINTLTERANRKD